MKKKSYQVFCKVDFSAWIFLIQIEGISWVKLIKHFLKSRWNIRWFAYCRVSIFHFNTSQKFKICLKKAVVNVQINRIIIDVVFASLSPSAPSFSRIVCYSLIYVNFKRENLFSVFISLIAFTSWKFQQLSELAKLSQNIIQMSLTSPNKRTIITQKLFALMWTAMKNKNFVVS